MAHHLSQYLRIAAVLACCGVLSACAHNKPACTTVASEDEIACLPQSDGTLDCSRVPKGTKCPIEYNVMQCFFLDTHLHGEMKAQFRELRRALKEALELPIEELQTPRYADSKGEPKKRTFGEIVSDHFCCGAVASGFGIVGTDTVGFYPSLKLPESIPILERLLKEVEERIGDSFYPE